MTRKPRNNNTCRSNGGTEVGFWADFPQGKKRKILIALKKLFLATGHH
jgi:hypothetical protein